LRLDLIVQADDLTVQDPGVSAERLRDGDGERTERLVG